MTKRIKSEVETRLGKEMDKLLKIDSVMMMTDVTRWEVNVQLISDIIISRDGIPGTIRNISEKQHVECHIACIDLLYKDHFHMPRIAAGTFFYSLNHIFHRKYNREIDYEMYGKPSHKIFDYASN